MYENTDGGFVLAQGELPGTVNGSLAWGDYDNDGDLDLAISGYTAAGGAITGQFTKIYRNDPPGQLSEDPGSSLAGVISSALAWADYDNDGDLDLALSGIDSEGMEQALIFENDPPGQLTERFVLEGVKVGSLSWADYDNDGDLDLAVIGNDQDNTPVLKLYRNDHSLAFEPETYRKLIGVDFGAISWCDVDGDGDLDLFTTGRERVEDAFPRTIVNDNLEGRYNPNRPPDPPGVLSSLPEASDVLLSWEPGGDLETAPEGLTYTLRVGTSSGRGDIFSEATGWGVANVGHGLSHRLRNLKSGEYYWSVQATDPGLKGSEWSTEESFIIDTEEPVVATNPDVTPVRVGIDQLVTVAATFYDEHTQLDRNVSPTVVFFPAGTETPVRVEELSYEGVNWTGTVKVSGTVPSGPVRLSISGAQDERGNVMEDWVQEGAFEVDTEVPKVIRRVPNPGQVGVSKNMQIKVTFNEPVDDMAIMREGLVHLEKEGERIPVDFVGYLSEERTLSLAPRGVLSSKTEYEVIVSAQVQDRVGNRMAGDARWSFRTAPEVEARYGETIENESKTISLYIPPNALEADQEVSLTEQMEVGSPEGDVRFTGIAFRFDPDTTSLRKPCALTVGYGEIRPIGEVEEARLALWRVADTWTRLGGTVDIENGRITTSVEELGVFALFEDASPPVGEFGLSNLKLSPRVFSPEGTTSGAAGSAKLLGALPRKTNISFVLTRDADVTIEIYNESGRLERVLMENRPMTVGRATVTWDGRDEDGEGVSSGLYIAVIRAGDLQKQKTVAVLNR